MGVVIFELQGLSFLKIAFTGLIWLSFGITITVFFANYKTLKRNLPKLAFLILNLLLLWNMTSVIRSFIDGQTAITTLLGNVNTTFALLTPFVIVFSTKIINVKLLQSYFTKVLKFGIVVFLALFIVSKGSFSDTQIVLLWFIFRPVVFLIAFYPFNKLSNKITILIGVVLIALIASLYDNRTMIIREVLLILGVVIVYFSRILKTKLILNFLFVSLTLPFLLLYVSSRSGESPIEKYFSNATDTDLSTDTRTFLYVELYADLTLNEKLIVGKGANGTYFSQYFSRAEGDAENRIDMEVGMLSILLKGGLVAVALNLLIYILAVYYAFFKSKNHYVKTAGFVLFIYTILFFLDNRIGYNSNDVATWFFIGVCLSKQLRSMSDIEIKQLFHSKQLK